MTEDSRTIVITGAASGIGAAIARRLAAPGVNLVLHTRQNQANLNAVAETVAGMSAQVALILGDLAEAETSARIVATARERFGRIDQIVSNAGKAKLSSFAEMSEVDLAHAFASMPQAFARLALLAMEDLKASPQARVVSISSFVAHSHITAGLSFPATAAAKAALESLTKSLALELASSGTANVVVPGFTRKDSTGHAATPSSTHAASTREIPMGRFAEPDDIAAAVTYLLSAEAGHVTGQTLHVNGGLLLR